MIVHPVSKKIYNIFDKEGRDILKSYINEFIKGGESNEISVFSKVRRFYFKKTSVEEAPEKDASKVEPDGEDNTKLITSIDVSPEADEAVEEEAVADNLLTEEDKTKDETTDVKELEKKLEELETEKEEKGQKEAEANKNLNEELEQMNKELGQMDKDSDSKEVKLQQIKTEEELNEKLNEARLKADVAKRESDTVEEQINSVKRDIEEAKEQEIIKNIKIDTPTSSAEWYVGTYKGRPYYANETTGEIIKIKPKDLWEGNDKVEYEEKVNKVFNKVQIPFLEVFPLKDHKTNDLNFEQFKEVLSNIDLSILKLPENLAFPEVQGDDGSKGLQIGWFNSADEYDYYLSPLLPDELEDVKDKTEHKKYFEKILREKMEEEGVSVIFWNTEKWDEYWKVMDKAKKIYAFMITYFIKVFEDTYTKLTGKKFKYPGEKNPTTKGNFKPTSDMLKNPDKYLKEPKCLDKFCETWDDISVLSKDLKTLRPEVEEEETMISIMEHYYDVSEVGLASSISRGSGEETITDMLYRNNTDKICFPHIKSIKIDNEIILTFPKLEEETLNKWKEEKLNMVEKNKLTYFENIVYAIIRCFATGFSSIYLPISVTVTDEGSHADIKGNTTHSDKMKKLKEKQLELKGNSELMARAKTEAKRMFPEATEEEAWNSFLEEAKRKEERKIKEKQTIEVTEAMKYRLDLYENNQELKDLREQMYGPFEKINHANHLYITLDSDDIEISICDPNGIPQAYLEDKISLFFSSNSSYNNDLIKKLTGKSVTVKNLNSADIHENINPGWDRSQTYARGGLCASIDQMIFLSKTFFGRYINNIHDIAYILEKGTDSCHECIGNKDNHTLFLKLLWLYYHVIIESNLDDREKFFKQLLCFSGGICWNRRLEPIDGIILAEEIHKEDMIKIYSAMRENTKIKQKEQIEKIHGTED